MAVVNIREVYPGVSLGLWQMDETVEQLVEAYPLLQAYRSQMEEKYKNDGRKLEFLAIRALMYEMLKTNGASKGLLSHAGDITHNEAGKPFVPWLSYQRFAYQGLCCAYPFQKSGSGGRYRILQR